MELRKEAPRLVFVTKSKIPVTGPIRVNRAWCGLLVTASLEDKVLRDFFLLINLSEGTLGTQAKHHCYRN